MTTTHAPRTISASTLKGDVVKNPAGEEVGAIEEVMLDLQNGQIAYLVMSFGGFLGIHDKFFALPWQAFTLSNTEKRTLCLDVDKETLKEAPGFDKHNWPDQAEHKWLVDVYEHYGYTPYWNS